ncbi:hypothetical protein A0J61_11965, partial [Choanephora cucurbitarum]
MSDLIRKQGPLRYYFCRSLERAIQKYTNLSKSRSRPAQENENIFTRAAYFKQLHRQRISESLFPPANISADEFRDYPEDIEGTQPQLWESFREVDMSSDSDFCGFSGTSVLRALKLYYRRLLRSCHEVDTVCEIAARMLLGDIIVQSEWYRTPRQTG